MHSGNGGISRLLLDGVLVDAGVVGVAGTSVGQAVGFGVHEPAAGEHAAKVQQVPSTTRVLMARFIPGLIFQSSPAMGW